MVTADWDEAAAGHHCSVCEQPRLDGSRPADYSVTPAAGGGWLGCGAALTRLLRNIGQNPTRIGWRPPTRDFDDPEEMPANWTLPLVRGDWQGSAELVLATVAGVFRFDENLPVQIGTFQIDHPCLDCFPQVAA